MVAVPRSGVLGSLPFFAPDVVRLGTRQGDGALADASEDAGRALDFAGDSTSLRTAAFAVVSGGMIAATGMAGGQLEFVAGVGNAVSHEVDLVLSTYGSMQSLRDVIALGAEGSWKRM